jgi:hypothetical protein
VEEWLANSPSNLPEERYSAGEAKLGTGRREHGIFAGRCAIDDEARAGKRLEEGGERGIADPIVRPGDARRKVSAASGLSSGAKERDLFEQIT